MKLWLVPVFFCAATAACAQDLKKFEFEPPVQQARDAKPVGRCACDNLSVPAGMRVLRSRWLQRQRAAVSDRSKRA